jgi:hypothetical protein
MKNILYDTSYNDSIPKCRSHDKINIMENMQEVVELSEIKESVVYISESEPTTILKCRSRDKINHMITTTLENQINDSKEPIDDTQYMLGIKFYFLYLLYGLIGGVVFNTFSSTSSIITFDMIFNCIISPIIYYHSPKHILMKIDKSVLFFCYTPCYILGLCFRFLDMIPEINSFTLNLITIDSTNKIILSISVLIIFLGICGYYLYKSRFPKINGVLFVLYLTSTVLSFYFFYTNGGSVYFHHYFIGLLVMIISRNYHSNIVVIIHAIAYGVYIDGISKWGYASIYHN